MAASTPEQLARETIDAMLAAAGWSVQSLKDLNLFAARGVAVREMGSLGGPADYMLFVDAKALGIVEAKKVGTTLSVVAEQSARYSSAKDFVPQLWAAPLPFTYETTGIETNFRDQRDPDSRSRLCLPPRPASRPPRRPRDVRERETQAAKPLCGPFAK